MDWWFDRKGLFLVWPLCAVITCLAAFFLIDGTAFERFSAANCGLVVVNLLVAVSNMIMLIVRVK